MPRDLPALPAAKASSASAVPFDPSQLPSLQGPAEAHDASASQSPVAMLGNALEGARAMWQNRG